MSNLSLPAAARVWGVSRRTAYRLAQAGLVRVARYGRRVTVPIEEVDRIRTEGVGPSLTTPVMSPPRRGRPRTRRGSRVDS